MEAFQELYQKVKDKRCLNELPGQSEEIILKDISKQCLMLLEQLNEFENNHYCLPKHNSSHTINSVSRDNILCQLSQFWDLYHGILVAGKRNICPSLLNIFGSLCTESLILTVLVNSILSTDHFIVYQAHKILQEILGVFPEIVAETTFQKMIHGCFSKTSEKSQWNILYILKLFMAILNRDGHLPSLANKHGQLPDHLNKCCCLNEEAKYFIITPDSKAIINIICHYWLDIQKQYIDNFFQICDECKLQKAKSATLQQTIALFLAVGLNLMKLYRVGNSQSTKLSEGVVFHKQGGGTDVAQKNPNDIFENPNETQLTHLKENFLETEDFQVVKNLLDEKCGLKLSESIQVIIEVLVNLDSNKTTLQFKRIIIQFLNDIVDLSFEKLLNMVAQQHGDDEIRTRAMAGVPIFLLRNSTKLFDGVPKVHTDQHFGGDVVGLASKESQSVRLVYDPIITRKVLLLIVKSLLVVLQEEASKFQYSDLVESTLENWLKFLKEKTLELKEVVCTNELTANCPALIILLFADQDDELVTMLLCLFKLYQQPNTSFSKKTTQLCSNLDAHLLFLEFLHLVHYDHSVLLDFLISNETCFLPYFLSYLHYMANNWNLFLEAVDQFGKYHKETQQTSMANELLENVAVIQQPYGQALDTTSVRETLSFIEGALWTGEQVCVVNSRDAVQNLNGDMFSEDDVEMSCDGGSGQYGDGVRVVEEGALVLGQSALLSIRNNYGDLSCSDSEGDGDCGGDGHDGYGQDGYGQDGDGTSGDEDGGIYAGDGCGGDGQICGSTNGDDSFNKDGVDGCCQVAGRDGYRQDGSSDGTSGNEDVTGKDGVDDCRQGAGHDGYRQDGSSDGPSGNEDVSSKDGVDGCRQGAGHDGYRQDRSGTCGDGYCGINADDDDGVGADGQLCDSTNDGDGGIKDGIDSCWQGGGHDGYQDGAGTDGGGGSRGGGNERKRCHNHECYGQDGDGSRGDGRYSYGGVNAVNGYSYGGVNADNGGNINSGCQSGGHDSNENGYYNSHGSASGSYGDGNDTVDGGNVLNDDNDKQRDIDSSGWGGQFERHDIQQNSRGNLDGNCTKSLGVTAPINCKTLTLPTTKYLDKTLSCLIRLRFAIERVVARRLFPYPVEALLKLISYIEELYENSDQVMETD